MAYRDLTTEEAIAMLPDAPQIHVFRNPAANVLVGSDVTREKIIAMIGESRCCVGGEECIGINHGLVIMDSGPLFVECREGCDYDVLLKTLGDGKQ